MVKIIGRTDGCYEVEDVEYGRVYKWCPESVAVECDCGERLTLTFAETTCGKCSVDHAVIVREELAAKQVEDEAMHPWRYAREREEAGLPF